MKRKCIVFPHLPKCGGTSLAEHLEASGLNVFFDYDAPPGSGPAVQRRCQRRNRDYAQLDFSCFDLVFGHFPIDRYVGSQYEYVALVRDPVERAVSSYVYRLKRAQEGRALSKPKQRMNLRLLSGNMSFLDHVRSGYCRNFYELYLQHWPRDRFQLIGSTEDYGTFLAELSKLLGLQISDTVHARKRSAGAEPTKEELRTARKLLKHEYSWYDEFIGNMPCSGRRTEVDSEEGAGAAYARVPCGPDIE